MSFSEIPIVFNSIDVDYNIESFTINDTNKTIVQQPQQQTSNSSVTLSSGTIGGINNASAASSISEISDDLIITTSMRPRREGKNMLLMTFIDNSNNNSMRNSSSTNSNNNKYQSIELDLSTDVLHFDSSSIIYVECFSFHQVVKAVMVDSSGTILSLHIDPLIRKPIIADGIDLYSIQQLILINVTKSSTTVNSAAIPATSSSNNNLDLHSTMITSISSSNNVIRLIVAMSPFILTIDFSDFGHNVTPRTTIWKERTCLSYMKQKQILEEKKEGYTPLLSKVADILIGKVDDEEFDDDFYDIEEMIENGINSSSDSNKLLSLLESTVDIPPTAAITSSISPSLNGNNTCHVFTLHSDSSVRHWMLQLNKSDAPEYNNNIDVEQHPFEVHVLQLDNYPNLIPLPSTWKSTASSGLSYGSSSGFSDDNTIALSCWSSPSNFMLSIHIETEIEDNGDSTTYSSSDSHHMIVLQGHNKTNPHDEVTTCNALQLAIPKTRKVISLFGMEFVGANGTGNSKPSLRTAFQGKDESNAPITLLMTYPLSSTNVSFTDDNMIQPIVTGQDYILDGIALSERDRINFSLSIVDDLITKRTANSDNETNIDLMNKEQITDIIHELDTSYMKYLFRSNTTNCYPHGNGTALPSPSSEIIKSAIQKLIPSYYRDSVSSSGNTIELDVLRAMQLWKKLDDNKRVVTRGINREVSPFQVGTPSTGSRIESPRKKQRGYFTPPPPPPPPPQQQQQPQAVATPMSVYHSYISGGRGSTTPPESTNGVAVIGNVENEEQQVTNNTLGIDQMQEDDKIPVTEQLSLHEKRWKKFLLVVWNEECKLIRMPLRLQKSILIRNGITSILAETSTATPKSLSGKNNTNFDYLDRISLMLLRRLKDNSNLNAQLCNIESGILHSISSSSSLLLASNQNNNMPQLMNKLRKLGMWSLSNKTNNVDDIIDINGVRDTLESMGHDDLLIWIDEHRKESSLLFPTIPQQQNDDETQVLWSQPGLTTLQLKTTAGKVNNSVSSKDYISNTDVRHSACVLTMQCINSYRQMQLGRCLLLFAMSIDSSSGAASALMMSEEDAYPPSNSTGDSIENSVFRSYLHSLSVLWVSSQQVELPLSFQVGGTADVINEQKLCGLISSRMTTALDVFMIHLLRNMNENASLSPLGLIIALSQTFFNSAFLISTENEQQKKGICEDTIYNRSAYLMLPELGALPEPVNDNVASDYPRLALRLLCPFIAYPSADDTIDTIRTRNETTAECLLIEANAVLRLNSKNETDSGPACVRELRNKACTLIAPLVNSDHIDDITIEKLETAYDYLKDLASSFDISGAIVDEKKFADGVRSLLIGDGQNADTTITSADISRLCQRHVMRSMFLPLILHPSYPQIASDDVVDAIQVLAKTLLKLSRLLCRLAMLEQHMQQGRKAADSTSSSSEDMLIEYIENTISDMIQILPPTVYQSMHEYTTLWSMLFQHAVAGRRWKKAYEACVNNPRIERKISNYKRLVIGMVDAGAAGELLQMCIVLNNRSAMMKSGGHYDASRMDIEDADTSDIALEGTSQCVDLYEIAAETLTEASYRSGTYYQNETSAVADYRGCLFALLMSKGDFRRSAQAMDMRYQTASTSFAQIEESGASVNDALIVGDMSLAALGTFHANQLVKDRSQQFIVSGELGPYPTLPVFDEEYKSRGNTGDQGAQDRLSNFMTSVDLTHRAIRTMVLRSVFLDESVSATVDALRFLKQHKCTPSVDSDRSVIKLLANLGYYQKAFLLAAVMKANYEERYGGSFDGRDLVEDVVSYVLTSHLVPVALNQSSTNIRPTYGQLRSAINSIDTSAVFNAVSETWRPRASIPDVSKSIAAMELIKRSIIARTGCGSPIALELSAKFLEVSNLRARLPDWLERFLLGHRPKEHNECSHVRKGLFATSPDLSTSAPPSKTFKGDPAGLIRLYMKEGMLAEACNAVSAVLLGTDIDNDGSIAFHRESSAPSRLPERGDIDFVPYNLIDRLWNIIESILKSSTPEPSFWLSEKKELKEVRSKMENALEKHFELMKISEMGMRSARALTQ